MPSFANPHHRAIGSLRSTGLGVALLVAAAVPAAAQAFGAPVINAGLIRGVTLHGMFALPNDEAGSGSTGVAGLTYGARRIAVTGFVSRRMRAESFGDDFYSVGAALTVKVFGGPLVPFGVNIQIGAAYASPTQSLVFVPDPVASRGPLARLDVAGAPDYGNRLWHLPIGLGLSWTIPQPVVALKPWIAPRIDITRATISGVGSDTATDFGLSGGVSFGFLNGVSIDLAYDRVFVGEGSPASFALGLSYSLR